MKLAGESENYGTEQEHLNGVFGSRVRISGLRAPSGPGVEFLDYLTPRDGRPTPVDSRANDLWHWQIIVVVSRTNMGGGRPKAGRVLLRFARRNDNSRPSFGI